MVFDWIEELRAEGQPGHVLDGLLVPMLTAGLLPWRHVPDPKGPARQLCRDFSRRTVAVLEAAANRLLDTARFRLPPVKDFREAVSAEGAAAAAKARTDALARAENPPPRRTVRHARGSPEFERALASAKADGNDVYARMLEARGWIKIEDPAGKAAA